jgi:hypothetical protein
MRRGVLTVRGGYGSIGPIPPPETIVELLECERQDRGCVRSFPGQLERDDHFRGVLPLAHDRGEPVGPEGDTDLRSRSER